MPPMRDRKNLLSALLVAVLALAALTAPSPGQAADPPVVFVPAAGRRRVAPRGRALQRGDDRDADLAAGRPSRRHRRVPLLIRPTPRVSPKEAGMEYGLFTMPSHPPERPLYDGHQ